MAEYFDEQQVPEGESGHSHRRRVRRRRRKRSGGPVVGKKKEEKRASSSRSKRSKKEAVARLDLSERSKVTSTQVVWIVVCGTVLFFSVGVIALDLIYNREALEDEVVVNELGELKSPRPDEAAEQARTSTTRDPDDVPSILDFEAPALDEDLPQLAEKEKRPGVEAYDLEMKTEGGFGDGDRIALVQEAYQARLYDKAIELGEDLLQRRRSAEGVRYWVGMALTKAGRPADAVTYFKEELGRRDDAEGKLLCLMALAKLAEEGHGDESPLSYFDRAMDVDREHPGLLKEFSLYLRRNERYQEGYYQTRRELARVQPDTALRGRVQFAALQADLFDPFEERHRKALQETRPDGLTRLVEAARLAVEGNSDEARKWMEEARDLLKGEPGALQEMLQDPVFAAFEELQVITEDADAALPGADGEDGENPEEASVPSGNPFELEMPAELAPLEP